MLIISWTTAALVIWVTLWGLGAKGFDAFMLVVAIVALAATLHLALPHLPGMRRR